MIRRRRLVLGLWTLLLLGLFSGAVNWLHLADHGGPDHDPSTCEQCVALRGVLLLAPLAAPPVEALPVEEGELVAEFDEVDLPAPPWILPPVRAPPSCS